MKNIKLVYILPEYSDSIGSHFYHKYEFLKRLDREINLFVVAEKGERPRDFQKIYIQRFVFFPFRALELFIILLRLRLKGYTIFWTHYSFVGGILAPLFGRSLYWNCGMPWLYRRSRAEEFFFRLAMRRSELVIGTEGLKSSYIERYGLRRYRVHVLPNWVDIERYARWRGLKKEAREELGLDDKKKVILFLHRLSKRKGANLIMPIAEGFENDTGVLFLIAGEGPLSDIIQGDNIKLVGSIPQRDTPKYFAAADIFLMPSEEEGFPHVLLESMAAGVPFVASDVGGVRDMVPESVQHFVVRQDVHLFQDRIRELFGGASLRKKTSETLVGWVSRYDCERVLGDFVKLVSREE
ncbi:MAG TPA: glycosyltransferase family 4 protein [Candidatus Paceibacterota bacterium]